VLNAGGEAVADQIERDFVLEKRLHADQDEREPCS
jgi:hypothetical protein